MATLFEDTVPVPLAERLRPRTFEDVYGQDHLLAPSAPLGRMIAGKAFSSFILWGPPGAGKTTIARLFANASDFHFEPISAVFSGVADLRRIFEEAKKRREAGQQTLLFVDEIHRFNRSQQDGFLPYVENGTVVLVGATTENPSFELNAALLSRCRVFIIKRLSEEALKKIVDRAEKEAGKKLPVTGEVLDTLLTLADGDGRYLINMMEELFKLTSDKELSTEELLEIVGKRAPVYDKDREEHYNLISALHKSLRGSDPDAALYWLARMLHGGEDPAYILRRLTRFSVEDVGMSDPNALLQAIAAWDAYDRMGSPEGDLAIAQLVVYLGTAPKSIGVYSAWQRAGKSAAATGSLMPPMHILNAPTKLMKEVGYGAGYQYDPDAKDGFSGQNYFPEGMERQKFYTPRPLGFERDIVKRLEYFEKLRKEKNG